MADEHSKEQLIAEYKRLLQGYIDLRPSGTRLKIANELGTNRSFVTQITSPTYPIPVPEQHIPTIMAVCHFSEEERAAFLAAYAAAHPERVATMDSGKPGGRGHRRLQILVPVLDDDDLQAEVEDAIRSVADRIIRLARQRR